MLDLSTIEPSILLARGEYATVRGAHEDAKKKLSEHCGRLSSVASQILRKMQPDNDGIPHSVEDLIASGRAAIDDMERVCGDIESLAEQRHKLKKIAW